MVQGSLKPAHKLKKSKGLPKLAKLKKTQKQMSKGRVKIAPKRSDVSQKVQQAFTREINRDIEATLLDKAQHNKESFKLLGKQSQSSKTSSSKSKVDVSGPDS
ncbi:hypothetical protein P9112_004913 [Eukaryota sp. TZLM1-RC]